ncbi:MAG TPA: S46 family peptidase, partial [Ignavibacteriaceae bacterium]|nr:S46 family peptidase [Ignavibacteriaceae bacterium]
MSDRILRLLPKILTLFSLLLIAMTPFRPDEGMFPLNEIGDLNLKSAGLKIDINEIYNPDSSSLVDALVNIGGCTGSFISPEGLIITNHHCVFGAVQKSSTTENNYLENGFLALTKEEEIPAKGITCKITVSYEDVSAEVLEAAGNAKDISDRQELIKKKINEIEKREETKDPAID